MSRYLIKEEFVLKGGRHLAGDVIELSDDAYADLVDDYKVEFPGSKALSFEKLPDAPDPPHFKPTMKPIDLPSGMAPADIPYTEPRVIKPSPRVRPVSQDERNRLAAEAASKVASPVQVERDRYTADKKAKAEADAKAMADAKVRRA